MPDGHDVEKGKGEHQLRLRQDDHLERTSAADWTMEKPHNEDDLEPSSRTDVIMKKLDGELVLGWKERTRHFSWIWFTMTMATGGLANAIYSVPSDLRFNGLDAIGCVLFILNIVLFIFVCIMITLRFSWWPSSLRNSMLHPQESLFVSAFVITIANILLNIAQYGLKEGKTGQWLITTMTVFYWLYVALAMVSSSGLYLLMWYTQTFTLEQMTPLWIFPAYPLLLVGPYAAALSSTTLTGQVGTQALDIIIGGVVCQGIGFMLSFMVFAAYIHRLMVDGLPAIASRPAMFISVGPAGFTVTALILMGEEIASCIPAEFMGNGELAGQVTKILAYWSGIWLWGLAIWFFFVSLGAHGSVVRNGGMSFAMTWYSWIFPNTALITATFAVAKALDRNYPIEILGCVMTCIIIAVWGMIFVKMGFAIASKEILWPRRQEDRDEEQWKKDVKAEQMKDAFGVDVDPDKMEIKLPDAIGRKKSRSQ